MDKELYDINAPPEFVKISPFRFVKPYDHVYKTNAKQRWIGKKLIEAMSDEFRAYSREYYIEAITKGKLTINGEIVSVDHIIAPQDRLEHSVFRVEPPVLDLPIEIVFEDRDLLVVSKPPSMIIHTGGGYHYNCLVGILFYERNPEKLYVLHRLDRLTSGLLLLSKNKRIAESFHDANGTHTVKKIYLARVHGNFPDDIEFNDKPQYCVSQKDAIFSCCTVDQIQQKQAKESKTLFKKLWYDEVTDSSLLECSPVTGRTHQIRVHLADLGYPILNDIGYGAKFIGNKIVDLNFKGLKQVGIRQQEVQDTGEIIGKKVKLNNEDAGQIEPQKEQQEILANCLAGKEEWDYHKHPLEIYLHSWKYTYKDQQFISQTPHWFEK